MGGRGGEGRPRVNQSVICVRNLPAFCCPYFQNANILKLKNLSVTNDLLYINLDSQKALWHISETFILNEIHNTDYNFTGNQEVLNILMEKDI